MKPQLLLCILLLCGCILHAAEINVPGKYPTIQAGVNAATDGDVVIVSPGTYRERVAMPTTLITLRSTNPDDPAIVSSTIINGDIDNDGTGDVVVIGCGSTTNDDSVISGFTITKGKGQYGGLFITVPRLLAIVFLSIMSLIGAVLYGSDTTVHRR